MLNLSDVYPDFPDILDQMVDGITRAPIAALGPACEEACVYFRTAGIAELLVSYNSDGFLHMLTRSALTRLHLLERTPPAEKEASRFCKISRSNGFFDGLAADRADLARRIVAAGPRHRNIDFEYEEDHAYVSFLSGLLLDAADDVQRKILDQWKALLDGQGPARYQVCLALLDRDAAGFDDVFAGLLDAWAVELQAQERSMSRDEMAFAGDRHVYVEGLAILRLAEMRQIATEPEYRYCPREARLPLVTPFPNDLYPGAPA
jgi:Immunity protein 49